eukprot:2027450-Lingulodinium_polyedra.AAC.1
MVRQSNVELEKLGKAGKRLPSKRKNGLKSIPMWQSANVVSASAEQRRGRTPRIGARVNMS